MWYQLLMQLAGNLGLKNTKDIDNVNVIQNNNKLLNNTSIYSDVSFDNIKNLNYEVVEHDDGTIDVVIDSKSTEEMSSDEKSIADILKQLLSTGEIKDSVDINRDGKIDDSEIKGFLSTLSAKDGDASNISADDFAKLLSDLDIELSDMIKKAADDIINGNVDVEYLSDIPEENEIQAAKTPTNIQNNNYAGRASNYGPATGSSPASPAYQAENRTVDDIKKEISDKESEIEQVNTSKEEEIQAEQEKYDTAVKEAMEEEKVDKEIQQEYEEQKTELEKEISTQNDNIKNADSKIHEQTAVIDAKTNAISAVEGQIGSLENNLNSIQDTGDAEKDKNNSAKRTEIQTKIDNLKAEKEKLEGEKTKAEEAKDTATEEKSEAEKAKADAEKEKDNLLQTMAEKYPDSGLDKVQDKTKELKAETDQKINSLKTEQKTTVEALQNDVQSLKTELANAEEKEKTLKVLKENSYGDASAAIDFAKIYEGMTQEQMRSVFSDKEYQFDPGAWCADFVRMAYGEGVGLENLPEWYQNSANPAYCPQLYSEAKQNNAIVSVNEAKPGDMVLFDWDGDGNADHVGILENTGNGTTINTVEGNTGGNGFSSGVASKPRDMSTVLAIVSMRT